MAEKIICKQCFYNYRTFPSISCKHRNEVDVYHVRWNEANQQLETTAQSIRPLPQLLVQKPVWNVRMCDPYTCKRDKCTFAHGEAERKKWQKLCRGCYIPGIPGTPRNQVLEVPPLPSLCQPSMAQLYYSSPLQLPFSSTGQEVVHLSLNGHGRHYYEKFSERVEQMLYVEDIKQKLTKLNYKQKFYNLICWEEKRHIEILEEKCNCECNFTLFQSGFIPWWIRSFNNFGGYEPIRYGFLQNLSADQIAYATQASEAACIVDRNGDESKEVRLEILRENFNHSDENMYVVFCDNECNKRNLSYIISRNLPSKQTVLKNLIIQFEVKHSYFDSLVRAVVKIKPDVITRILPSPDEFLKYPTSPCLNFPDLLPRAEYFKVDDNQKSALHTILSSDPRSPPVIVNGSFGTGKTRLLAVATHCLIKQAHQPVKVLLCAHHQSSADHFIEQYFGPMVTDKHHPLKVELIRLTSSNYTVRNSNFQKYYTRSKDMCNYLDYYHHVPYLVVATTFLTSVSLLNMFGVGFFTHIMLDEGSQSREPEAIAPLCLANSNTKLIIAGDSCQVGPALLVLGEECRENGLKYSLLERLQIHYKCHGIVSHHMSLNTNYRCHRDIVEIPNNLFYDDKVLSCPRNAQPHPSAPFPLLFVCSSLSYDTDEELEANLILQQAMKFVGHWPTEWGKKDLTKVCLAMASRPQLVITRHIARKKFDELKFIHMLTTYDIQGKEFQALFVSTTEPVDASGNTTNPTKSPCDPYVFNTLLTRSISLVVAVGSPLALLKIEEHMEKLYGGRSRCWSSYLRKCWDNNTFFIPPELKRDRRACHQLELQLKAALKISSGTPTSITSLRPQVSRKDDSSPAEVASLKETFLPVQRASSLFNNKAPSLSDKNSLDKFPVPKGSLKVPNKGERIKERSKSSRAEVSSKETRLPVLKPSSASNNKAPSSFSLDEFPTLKDSLNVPKKEVKKMKERNKRSRGEVRPTDMSCISSSCVQTPACNSQSYNEYKERLTPELLKQQLTAETYKEKFHHLLCCEEQEHDKQLAERCNKVYEIHVFQPGYVPDGLQYDTYEDYKRFGYITSEDSDTLSHAKQASEGSYIILDNNSFVHARHVRAFLPYVANINAIPIAFGEGQLEKLKKSKYFSKSVYSFEAEVRFELKHSYFQRLHNAVKHLTVEITRKLNPSEAMLRTSRPDKRFFITGEPVYDNIRLDQQVQMKALHTILNSSSDWPILIAGPFGTGKTRLLARAAYEILKMKRSRVLICAHHQASVDTFLEYFGAMKDADIPWAIDMIRITPKRYRSATKERYCSFFKTGSEVKSGDLEKNRLIITTLGMAPYLYHKIPGEWKRRGFYTDILIDEGAQTREPETVGPLSLAGRFTRIVIAGDHRQVGPRLLVLGEEAQRYGLGTSLLERLHTLYDKANRSSSSNACSATSVTLLTNYRCHSGILMLPSSLYYQSTLQCRVPDSEAHDLAPFPLVFSCSDVKQSNNTTSGGNEEEAGVLIEEVCKYFKKWPKHWDKKDKKICIMSPSPVQCSLLKKKIKQKVLDCKVEVLKAYEIQGTEFKAIFISTSEPTNEDGEPIYKTKSICDQYVFNTAITRSQSLVVVVGNPFHLLEAEKHMVSKYEGSKCWSPYIKQCIECGTFSYSTLIRQSYSSSELEEASDKLYSYIYSDTVSELKMRPKPLDSIIKAYKKLFESMPDCKRAKVTLSNSKGSRLSWRIDDYGEESDKEEREVNYSDRYPCALKIKTFREAEAIPLDSTKKIVKIQGTGNRIGAFDGDTVIVGVFEDNPPNSCYGRVLEVTERGSDLKFICRVSYKNPIVFYPIDKKNPIMINLPKLSRDLLQKKNREEINESDLKCNDVVVFDPTSYDLESDNVPLPQIKQVIPLSVAKSMLFLVSFVRWEPKYRTPLAIVIGVYCKGYTQFNAKRLLQIKHSVDYNEDGCNAMSSAQDMERDSKLPFYDRAFTIDPQEALNLDDALSLVRINSEENCQHKVYQLGVHIVNAAKHIQPGTNSDEFACSKCTSVYGGEKGKVMHMLPSDTRCQLSLTPGKIRDVISVTCRVMLDPRDLTPPRLVDLEIKPAQIKSAIQLTYEHAQDIMDGKIPETCAINIKEFDDDGQDPSLQRTLKLLYEIAKKMRQRRLSSNAAFVYKCNDSEDEAYCWQSHLLVEELMIWANRTVAECIHTNYPEASLLRRQGPPNIEEKMEHVNDNQNIMACSLSLSRHLSNQPSCVADTSFLIPFDTLKLIYKALSERNMVLLASYLSSDRLYPQLAAVESIFKAMLQRAEYCCTSANQTELSFYRHDSLCLNEYTHFTSPLRRYIDIKVQRMLLETYKEEGLRRNFTCDEHSKLCTALNLKGRNASDFEREMKKIELTFKFLSSSKACTAFITRAYRGIVELTFPQPELNHFPLQAKKVKITSLIPIEEVSDKQIYVWKLHITSLSSDLAASILKSLLLSVSRIDANLNDCETRLDMFSCCSNNETLISKPFKVSYQSSVLRVPSQDWLKALEFVKNPSEEKMDAIREMLPQGPPMLKSTSINIDTEQNICPFLDFAIKVSLNKSDVLKVWLSWSMREPIISPVVQLVEVSPFFRICVQHNSHPAECFSDPNFSPASRAVYTDINQYIDLWKKVLLAEAAEKSIKECQPVIIRDVELEWPKLVIPRDCIDEHYYIPSESVVIVLPKHFVDNCFDFFKVNVGDLLCVRYGYDPHHPVKAVFHFVAHFVKDDSGEVTISMKNIGTLNCRVSEEMKDMLESGQYTCELQIISLSYSYRKVFRGLLSLAGKFKAGKFEASMLSKNVAVEPSQLNGPNMKIFNKRSESIVRNDPLATSISMWSSSIPTKSLDLNEGQKKAMSLALRREFQLIQGPPGTGKSETGAHIAYIFAELNKDLNMRDGGHKCVLYCGPSNKSVDVVFEKFCVLMRKAAGTKLSILRIYSSAVERKDYPGPDYNKKHASDTLCPEWARQFSLHHMVREPARRKVKVFKDLADIEELIKQLKEQNKIPSSLLCNKYREILKDAEKLILKEEKFDVVFCTCNEASGDRLRTNLSVRQCIIDECGMAYEPETIVPISLCEHAVLIGDHMQLQPVIDYKPAKDCGLSTSLFERYAQRDEEKSKFTFTLTTQYRMHKAICAFPSEHFYDNQLETANSVINRKNHETRLEFWPRGRHCPIVFVDVVGNEGGSTVGSKGDTKVGVDSKFNITEAEKVIEIAHVLHVKYDVPMKEIAVLTPYSAQKNKIREMAKTSKRLHQLKVVSITESQGNEHGIVILSTVRSQPLDEIRNPHYVQADHSWLLEHLGFITDKHQINVGITRSKYGLIIIGNKTLLEYDSTWKSLLEHYKERGCVVDGGKFPPPSNAISSGRRAHNK